MKRLLLGDNRPSLLSTVEALLKHWGYRVLSSSRPEQLKNLLKEMTPDLLLLGAGLLADTGLRRAVKTLVIDGGCPLLVLHQEGFESPQDIPHDLLKVPVELFTLFEQVQRHMERFPRKNLRLAVRLPGMFSREEQTQLAEVLSLSTQGIMIKTTARLQPGDQIHVYVPLVGMRQELEIEGKVLYNVSPAPENNYLQGVGIGFVNLTQETSEALERFVKKRLFGAVTAENAPPGVDMEQIARSESPA